MGRAGLDCGRSRLGIGRAGLSCRRAVLSMGRAGLDQSGNFIDLKGSNECGEGRSTIFWAFFLFLRIWGGEGKRSFGFWEGVGLFGDIDLSFYFGFLQG